MKKNCATFAIQDGLQLGNNGSLQSLWMEIPGRCNLACSYCFAYAEKINEQRLMTFASIEKMLEEAALLGVRSLGIPGAGEPFLPSNISLTKRILYKCTDLGIFVTLFTTSEFITQELAEELLKLQVELLIKCNSLNPDTQDRFVSDPKRNRIIRGYGKIRNKKIQLLLDMGFADETIKHKSRMGLVTSIMTSSDGKLSNLDDVPEILRFCRRNNILFDSDSVLKRGKGGKCGLSLGDIQYREKVLELQKIDDEEFGNKWIPSQSYVGGPACDRCFPTYHF